MEAKSEFKYHLASRGEMKVLYGNVRSFPRCPACGRDGYKVYVYRDGAKLSADDTCGRCDHENSCGYHVSPSAWMKSNGVPDYQPRTVEARQAKRIEIPPHVVSRTIGAWQYNGFVRFVRSLPWSADEMPLVEYKLEVYGVGTTRKGGTIWWQIDEQGVTRSGKIITYGADGHRLKNSEGKAVGLGWVHSLMQRQGYFQPEQDWQLVQCLFGLHLLRNAPKKAECHIVESEKTAVLMSLLDRGAFRSRIWLACGGLNMLTEQMVAPLRGRKVVAYPDADGLERWSARCKELGITLATEWLKAVKPEDGRKPDVADVAVRLMAERTASEARQAATCPAAQNHPTAATQKELNDMALVQLSARYPLVMVLYKRIESINNNTKDTTT